MREREIIATVKIKNQSVGHSETAAGLKKVEDALARVGAEAEKTGQRQETSARRQASLANAFGRLEQRVDPVARAMRDLERAERLVNDAVSQNASLTERGAQILQAYESRLSAARAAAGKMASANDNIARSSGLARHELVNLSRQAQDVGTMFAMGASPMQIFSSQASQIFDIFSSSEGTFAGFVGQMRSGLSTILTAGRLAFGGIAAAVGAAGFALNGYLDSQQKVAMALTGAGRASGATVAGINSVASQGASTFGLSVSEARELATALAATGKVANDNILPIVKMGKDIAHAFGIDAAEANKMLATAFADPARGAETLNQRLGFLDASMKRNIDNLVAQNRIGESQKLLLAGLQAGLEGVDAAVARAAKGWTAVGNAISNAWDWLGKYSAKILGLGQIDPAEQIKKLDEAIGRLQARIAARSEVLELPGWAGGNARKANAAEADEVARLTRERSKYAEVLQRQADAATRAQAAQRSFLQESAVRQALPDIAQFEALQNQAATLEGAISDTKAAIATLVPDEATGSRLKSLTEALQTFGKALDKTQTQIRDFKTENERARITAAISLDAVGAYSPSARADIARRQAFEANRGNPEAAIRAQEAYSLSLKQSTEAIREQARERQLTALQNLASAQLEINLIGKSIAQQAEARTNTQKAQQLELPAEAIKPVVANDNSRQREQRNAS